jgi:hypothetical protein
MAARNLAVRPLPLEARLLRRRGRRLSRPRREELEAAGFDPQSGELLVTISWFVIGSVPIGEDELNAARRRAMFVLAAGGDPHRELDLSSVAAERLADELDAPERREALARALAELETGGLPNVSAGVAALLGEPDLAWRSFGLALLADELADE